MDTGGERTGAVGPAENRAGAANRPKIDTLPAGSEQRRPRSHIPAVVARILRRRPAEAVDGPVAGFRWPFFCDTVGP